MRIKYTPRFRKLYDLVVYYIVHYPLSFGAR
jgi:hypothetical protein